MVPPTDSVTRCQTKDDSMSRNTNSAATTASFRRDPESPQSLIPKLDHSSVNNPPAGPIAEPERARISREVVQGLHLLGLDMPQGVTAKVAQDYTNMHPMERFLAETCKVDVSVPVQDAVGGAGTSSCQANAESFKSEQAQPLEFLLPW